MFRVSDLNPEGIPGMSDVSLLSGISGLSADSTFLATLLFFSRGLLLFLSCLFSPCLLLHSPDIFSQKILQQFSFKNRLFCKALV